MTASSPIPSHFLCDITKTVMKDPMMSRYGNHFEREAIMEWLSEHSYCPVTRKPLRVSNLISDKTLKFKIQSWQKMHGSDDASSSQSSTDDLDVSHLVSSAQIAIAPQRFICPLGKTLMKDPVMTKTGVNYERKNILKHLQQQGYRCPVTKKELKPSGVISNSKLAWEIAQWNLTHGDSVSQQQSAKASSSCGSKAYFASRTPSAPLYHILSQSRSSSAADSATATTLGDDAGHRQSKDLTNILEDVMATLEI
eukprot:CAMPEP_0119570702 /NCGR_PEP_ID=MMETSP1352-20130426/43746_1 /TAXON_ID=265584 /ORGANISM="Stauroneis constricta, Strain CCMP1120" /LENGTH=252 /DNA_ID=CAMNT_0007620373 /DNA_START=168 /DNA_END=926 /DNA_ORIENTATION=+